MKPRGNAPRGARPAAALRPPRRTPRAWVAALLALHFALLAWCASRNSVTFDENFHLPAGVVALARADFSSSYAQPPLARLLPGAAALAAGARLPDPKAEAIGAERTMGESFMRVNADRYQRVFFAGRLAAALVSVLLGLLLWRLADRWYGRTAGLLALAAWTLSPEALAHGSLVGVDVPTALTFFGATLAGLAWLRTGRWRAWGACAAWLAAAFLVRFSAVQLFAILPLLALGLAWRRRLASVPRTLAGFVLLGVVALLAVNAGYLFEGTLWPLARDPFLSVSFKALAQRFPGLRVPLPVPYLLGLDYLSLLSQPGEKLSYFLGALSDHHDWRYFPVAIAVKWPLGLLALLALRLVRLLVARRARVDRELALLLPVAIVLGTAMSANLDYGVRYVLPTLPFLLVWGAGAAAPALRRESHVWARAAVLLVALAALEGARALPYPLAFFNLAAGGPGRGDRIVNDSNVDWGQGLIALRDELRARGVRKVQLLYHGTTDPSLYGLDWVPFFGGEVAPDVQYLAVSSYFLVGLPARILTPAGFTPEPKRFDLRPLLERAPDARAAGCIYLYRVR